MSQSVSPAQKPRSVLSARRLVLLASAAVIGVGVLFSGAEFVTKPQSAFLASPAYAQTAQRPVGFADIVEKVKPSVISVRVKVDGGPRTQMSFDGDLPFPPGSPMERFFRRFGMPDERGGDRDGPRGPRGGGRNFTMGQGSGFFISADGYAVTNNHVVDKAESVEVTTDDGKTHTAKVIGTDPKTDIALIKVEGGNDFPFVPLAEKAPRIGDWVLAVGNPFGLGGTVTAGIVSARGRDIGAGPYDDFIQIDAPVNKGNSGGPTFDVDGNVIGVNTAIFSPSGGSVGIAFAIPADTVKTVVTPAQGQGRGHARMDRRADPAGHRRHRRQPRPEERRRRAGRRAAGRRSGREGRHPVRRRDHRGQWRGGRRMRATSPRRSRACRPARTCKLGVIRKGAEKTLTLTLGELPREQRQATRRRPMSSDGTGTRGAAARPLARSGRQGRRRRRRRRRGDAGRSGRAGRRARLPHRRRDPRCRRQARRPARTRCARRSRMRAPAASAPCCCA